MKLLSLKAKAGRKGGNKAGTHEVFWPLDLLPEDCADTRVLTWRYDSNVSHYFNGPETKVT
jgi:hypothetical protein